MRPNPGWPGGADGRGGAHLDEALHPGHRRLAPQRLGQPPLATQLRPRGLALDADNLSLQVLSDKCL